ncbi:MAG TPA: VIT1/CCC1 transporter family protein [Thermoanaerobaculia bacterium]|nr:VIT1/CCC1 transporter family protein [Thermoanaerobaculia bacterium]
MEHEHSPEAIRERLAAGPRTSYLRDWVYGGIDGSVTTFAIVSGVVGASLPPATILILGAANLVADGFSMAAGNYSATRTEAEELRTVRAVEERHVARNPEGEREEVRQLLAAKGLSGAELDAMVELTTADRRRWIDFMLIEEYGLSLQTRPAVAAALATFSAFILCGVVPLLPFLFRVESAFIVSIVLTMTVFFAIGSTKARWLTTPWWRAGLETLAIGALASALAYAVGVALKGIQT